MKNKICEYFIIFKKIKQARNQLKKDIDNGFQGLSDDALNLYNAAPSLFPFKFYELFEIGFMYLVVLLLIYIIIKNFKITTIDNTIIIICVCLFVFISTTHQVLLALENQSKDEHNLENELMKQLELSNNYDEKKNHLYHLLNEINFDKSSVPDIQILFSIVLPIISLCLSMLVSTIIHNHEIQLFIWFFIIIPILLITIEFWVDKILFSKKKVIRKLINNKIYNIDKKIYNASKKNKNNA